jgi:mRNA interferase HicA
MNAKQLVRELKRRGCTIETHRGGSGHLTVIYLDRRSQLPMHGGGREIGKKLLHKILKQLDIEL